MKILECASYLVFFGGIIWLISAIQKYSSTIWDIAEEEQAYNEHYTPARD